MEEQNKQIEVEQKEVLGSGSLLAEARKSQNKTVEEIAQELNLSVSQIKTIELDQSEGLPEPTYVRGYIRSYAKLLDLDVEQVLEHYLNPNWQKSTSLDDMPKGIGNTDEPVINRYISITPPKLIVSLALIISFLFLWYTGLLGDLFGVKRGTEVIPISVSQEPSDIQTNDVDVASVNESLVSDLNQTEEQQSAAVAEPIDKVLHELTLNFSQTSWVDIRDANDNRLAYKSYAAGEKLDVSSEDKLSVFLGNAEGVSAVYNGDELDISSYREGVYAKFVLGN